MKKPFIPLEKQTKRKQREFFAARRGDWGGINPVTRKPPNPKAYNRKKSGQWYQGEPQSGFFASDHIILRCPPVDGSVLRFASVSLVQ